MVDGARSTGRVYRAIHGRRSLGPFTIQLPGNDSPNGTEPTRACPAEAQDPRGTTLVGAGGRSIGPFCPNLASDPGERCALRGGLSCPQIFQPCPSSLSQAVGQTPSPGLFPLQEALPKESEQVAVCRSAIRTTLELTAYLVRSKKSAGAVKNR